ncbi:L-rhamnose mutarotase [Salinicola sp. MIT1003]|uniref:L-rhamnose mutarotase n=1 Tax=Salinicola sp. MIT1003 TaxID=1882734 RepID=UPI0008DD12A1|nr:L-rhamnose mutarotase [Salinicola sp. MIT1003]OHZ00416.1 hypothetical protein BC443_16785 [Salinicola sp. MIT1003]
MSVRQRLGSVIRIKRECIEHYIALHDRIPDEVVHLQNAAGLYNYTIFIRELPDGYPYLFSYVEYHGQDLDKDMEALSAAPAIQEWWARCKPCHEPIFDRAEGEWWASMRPIFHHA